ncbi:MAG: DNA-protecting protein DprA [Bacteroidetes bacterium]|nr:MAG: DNA-protecting protein DprA [Bacteroidota bacterium]
MLFLWGERILLDKCEDILKYQIALSLAPGIGPVLARILVSYCGGVQEIFQIPKSHLEKIPGIGPEKAIGLHSKEILVKAEREVVFIRKHSIQSLFYLDKDYPARLKYCEDSPILLFFKGKAELNSNRVVAIVGTRQYSPYGRELTESLVEDFLKYDVLIVSGLAYGIDIIAHRSATFHQIPTVAVTAHGLDRIYPSAHISTAEKMIKCGGILTEYISGTKPDRENFPSRNRIVAGMCDATIVIESGIKGGALITAEIANGYNRDVFAFPGRVKDLCSQGCLQLIRENKATLVTSADDIARAMNWDLEEEEKIKKMKKQLDLFLELDPEQKKIISILQEDGVVAIDLLAIKAGMPVSKVSSILLGLEFSGVLRSLPGKVYELI